MEKINNKKLYRVRMTQILVATIVWPISLPIMKNHFNLVDPTLLGMLAIYAMLLGTQQEKIGKMFSMKTLYLSLVVLDVIFLVVNSIIVKIDLESLIIFDQLISPLYTTVLMLLATKVNSITIRRYKASKYELFNNKITSLKFKGALIGMIIGTILVSLKLSIVYIVYMQSIGLLYVAWLSYKQYKIVR